MRLSAHGRSSWRGVFLALTVLAVSMRVLIPPGFMTGDGPGQPLVICTGHGPLRLYASLAGHAPATQGGLKADAPCLFAALAAAPPPTPPMLGPSPFRAGSASQHAKLESLVSGPALGAAPPPARAPPAE
jgi:hypothetical protein